MGAFNSGTIRTEMGDIAEGAIDVRRGVFLDENVPKVTEYQAKTAGSLSSHRAAARCSNPPFLLTKPSEAGLSAD